MKQKLRIFGVLTLLFTLVIGMLSASMLVSGAEPPGDEIPTPPEEPTQAPEPINWTFWALVIIGFILLLAPALKIKIPVLKPMSAVLLGVILIVIAFML